MQPLIEYFQSLFSLTKEMAPYLLLGFLVAGILHVYVPRGAFTKYFGGKNLKSVLYASMMGIPLPLCSCGVIPTGISLYKEGASKGATLSFLISTPQTGVDSIMVTYSLLGLPFAILRPVIALITGLLGGLSMNAFDKKDEKKDFRDENAQNELPKGNKIKRILSYSFDELFNDIGDWLLIGLALAAVIAVLIPASFFQSSMMANEFTSMLLVLIASVPFYVCATGSVPIAAVLLMKGLNPGSVLVFLMAGPATNIATITVISRSLGIKSMWVYISSIVLASFAFGFLINEFFPRDFFMLSQGQGHEHSGGLMYWIEFISAGLFIFFLLRIYVLKLRTWYRKKIGKKLQSTEKIKIEVEGMTCQNCASKVESVLLKLPEINASNVDLQEKSVEIQGKDIDLSAVRKEVEKAGYTYKSPIENE